MSTARFKWLRDAALCLSASNLLFLKSWEELFRLCSNRIPSPTDDAWIPAAFSQNAGLGTLVLFQATLINVVTLSGVLWLIVFSLRRSNSHRLLTLARCGFLFLIVGPLDFLCWKLFILGQTYVYVPILRLTWSLLISVPIIGLLQMVLFRRDTLYRGIRAAVMILIPLPLLSTFQIGSSLLMSARTPAPELSEMISKPNEGRVIWVIFDELDQRMAFDERPSSILLPEFDRLLKESLYATKAKSPAWDTKISMASLITRRLVKDWNTFSAPSKLILQSGEEKDIRQMSTVFTEARAAGFNTAIAGWLVPYCAILAKSLNFCAQPTADDLKPTTVWHDIKDLWLQQLEEHWLVVRFGSRSQSHVPWFGWSTRKEQYLGYLYIHEHAMRMALDPGLGLLLIHWPIPHPLGIYDRVRNEIALDSRSNYIDNLELADRTLGELRKSLEDANLWAETSLIVSSDHPYRPDAWSDSPSWTKEEADLTKNRRYPYVPFIVKVAGQRQVLRYERPFNTLLTGRLTLALLRKEVRTAENVAEWLDSNSIDRLPLHANSGVSGTVGPSE